MAALLQVEPHQACGPAGKQLASAAPVAGSFWAPHLPTFDMRFIRTPPPLLAGFPVAPF